MAATDKDVIISVLNRTITVQLVFLGAPEYIPTVTVTGPLPGGQMEDITATGTPIPGIPGGTQFVKTVQQDGDYAVNVQCSGKSFGNTYTLPPVPPATNPTVSRFMFREGSS
jgi:hypothetical protein